MNSAATEHLLEFVRGLDEHGHAQPNAHDPNRRSDAVSARTQEATHKTYRTDDAAGDCWRAYTSLYTKRLVMLRPRQGHAHAQGRATHKAAESRFSVRLSMRARFPASCGGSGTVARR